MLNEKNIAIKGDTHNIKKLLKDLKTYKLLFIDIDKYKNNLKSFQYDLKNYLRLLGKDGHLLFLSDVENVTIRSVIENNFPKLKYMNTFLINKNEQKDNDSLLNENFKFVFLYSNSDNIQYNLNSEEQCIGWIDLKADELNENKIYTYKLDKCYGIDNTKWKWSEKRVLRAINNYNEYLKNKNITLKEYWKENKEKYQKENNFELEFVRCNQDNVYYYDFSPRKITTNLTNYNYEENGLIYILKLILNKEEDILTNKYDNSLVNELIINEYNATFMIKEDEVENNLKGIYAKNHKQLEIIELVEN